MGSFLFGLCPSRIVNYEKKVNVCRGQVWLDLVSERENDDENRWWYVRLFEVEFIWWKVFVFCLEPTAVLWFKFVAQIHSTVGAT
jgi:hypothetical protein